ncbi:MAG TPA: hypothetical protein VIM58_13230 [Candidatus Methylacidiphilales bacterium]
MCPSPACSGLSVRRSRGSALIATLLVIVLITSIILAYFTHAQLQRQISFSSAGMARANALAQTAGEIVAGDLLNEIKAGSTVATSNGVPIYLPVTNYAAVPQASGNGGVTNLVKISAGGLRAWASSSRIAYATEGPLRAIAGNSTTNASSDGRKISRKRWLKPEMVSFSQTNAMPIPDWIIVARNGPIDASAPPSLQTLADLSPSNRNGAIGRFAYAIYDEGGLLDVTSAGFRSTETGSGPARKGFLAYADLTRVPNGSSRITQQQVDALVGWRNAASASAYAAYLGTYGATNGFLRVQPGDQTFVGRQDLINYAQKNGFEGALPYLGTFSRERSAPNWMPRANAADLGGNNGPGNVYAYRSQAEAAGSANRDLANVRAPDGTPLLPKRFPLSRLALLSGGSASDIYSYFGLTGASGQWTYNHGNGARILTLDEVAKAGRSPDFFELLKAAILQGSLGLGAGTAGLVTQPAGTTSADNHIIQIGANVIDQYDADSLPTTITFNGRDFYGVEDLPYITRALYYCAIDPANPGQMAVWIQPELWRPYQSPNAVAGAVPARVRFQISGSSFVYSYSTPSNTFAKGPTFLLTGANGQIDFDPSKIPRESPAGLSGAHTVTSPSANNLHASWPSTPAGVYLGYVAFPAPSPSSSTIFGGPASGTLSLELQWQNGTSWQPYARLENISTAPGNNIGSTSGSSSSPVTYLARTDPRTDRFGATPGWAAAGNAYAPNQSLRPSGAAGYFLQLKLPNASNFHFSAANQGYLGLLSDNIQGTAAYYSDPDGVVRRAAGAYATATGTDGYPLIPSALSSDNQNGRRPLVLNRPFQSVAEMGYAFRDLPFKELDFFTKESADAGLLDVFCVNEEPSVSAGRLSPNTPHAKLLEAMLYGAARREYAAGATLVADVPALAQAIVSYVAANGPLLDRGELVTKLSDALTPAFSSNDDRADKTQRESVVRALADAANLRTWNLMIDVVAQSGRYPAKARTPDDFVVEGEKRLWIHIAIDRYTGEIVDRVIEPVAE